eukprot:3480918-Rhodomonas_salina.3
MAAHMMDSKRVDGAQKEFEHELAQLFAGDVLDPAVVVVREKAFHPRRIRQNLLRRQQNRPQSELQNKQCQQNYRRAAQRDFQPESDGRSALAVVFFLPPELSNTSGLGQFQDRVHLQRRCTSRRVT